MASITTGNDPVPNRNAVLVHVCCNDPSTGNFAGRAEQISVGAEFLNLETCRSPAPRFRKIEGGVSFARRTWPILAWKPWVGNWCWNGYWVEIPTAVELLAWLHQRKLYTVTSGENRIFSRWCVERPFDKDDCEFLERILGKPSTHDEEDT